jgi:hypothetical protein
MNNHNRGIEPEDETNGAFITHVRLEKHKHFGKQASLRELEDTGVDSRTLKHNRLFSFNEMRT